MKKLLIPIGMIVILGIVAIVAFFPRETEENTDEKYTGHSTEECFRLQIMCMPGFERFDDENGCGCQPTAEEDGLEMYVSEEMGFTMMYHPALIVQKVSDKEVRFFRKGPTQKGQTEMNDGMMLSIQKIDAPDGVQKYIDTQVGLVSESVTVTTPLHEDMLNGVQTQTFSASGLGDFTTIFIPLDDSTLFELSYMIVDTTGAGFQDMIDDMLSSMNLMR